LDVCAVAGMKMPPTTSARPRDPPCAEDPVVEQLDGQLLVRADRAAPVGQGRGGQNQALAAKLGHPPERGRRVTDTEGHTGLAGRKSGTEQGRKPGRIEEREAARVHGDRSGVDLESFPEACRERLDAIEVKLALDDDGGLGAVSRSMTARPPE
jgi:hypothetical protein